MTTDTPPARVRRGRRGPVRLTRRDRIVVAVMIGIPVLLDLAFIWGPAVATTVFSFTNATGAAPVAFVNE